MVNSMPLRMKVNGSVPSGSSTQGDQSQGMTYSTSFCGPFFSDDFIFVVVRLATMPMRKCECGLDISTEGNDPPPPGGGSGWVG